MEIKVMFIDHTTLNQAIDRLFGTAGHLLKIWFVLKLMGLEDRGNTLTIDTSNSTEHLKRLFDGGDPDGRFYIPFAHTPRYLSMAPDASRSIIQTTIKRWASSGSVVTCDPTGFLDIASEEGQRLTVKAARRYPFGLGHGENGFALEEGSRVALPIVSFAVWFYRQHDLDGYETPEKMVDRMLKDLNFTDTERTLIFVDDDLIPSFRQTSLLAEDIFASCQRNMSGEQVVTAKIVREDFKQYSRKVKNMVTNVQDPVWLRSSPADQFRKLMAAGEKAILLFGPPRTGKTRIVDEQISRDDEDRCTIQIHDGWGYDELIEGFRPNVDGKWSWVDGPLKSALREGKRFIVLEEVNRTDLSQALGEIFSLLEVDYRGEVNAITLRSGQEFFIDPEVTIIMTMNNIDKSTEEVDDALFGRMAAVEFTPRAEDLIGMLSAYKVPDEVQQKLATLFRAILDIYPLGHGYFSGLRGELTDERIVSYYLARIRPVLLNFLGELRRQDLGAVDNMIDDLFAG